MKPYDFNYFYEFECEYEALKSTTTDVLELSYRMIEFIQEKLKELGKWLKTYLFTTVQEEIHFFKVFLGEYCQNNSSIRMLKDLI